MKIVKKVMISICLLVFFISGWIGYNQLNPIIISSHGTSAKQYENLSQIESEADLIVEVNVLKGSKEELKKDNNVTPYHGYTITPVEIIRTIKSSEGFDKLNKINVYEPSYSFTVPSGKKFLQTIEKYSPLKSQGKYILFLKKFSDDIPELKDTFYSLGSYQGKYIISSKITDLSKDEDFTSENLDIIGLDNKYKKLYKEVIEKYKEK